MSLLQKLRVKNLRNLAQISLDPSERVNLLYGSNGSGKTSVLEAIHVLALGRSFRSRQMSSVIRLGEEEAIIYGRVSRGNVSHELGVGKARNGETRYRVDGGTVGSVAELAGLLPVVLLLPETFELLNGGPLGRRQFLDWGVFHVEHSYLEHWRNYQRSLKQRNSLLRRGRIDGRQLAVWDEHLVHYGEIIDAARRRYLDLLEPKVRGMLEAFQIDTAHIRIDYARGWGKDRSFAEVLLAGRDRDIAGGRTLAGPHRCDLRLTVQGLDARDHLSRGQQKVVICALKLAQGACLADLTKQASIYLIDDLHAELDDQNARVFCRLLEQLQTQVFITSLNKDVASHYWSPDLPLKMFHVEQGGVNEVPLRTSEEFLTK